MELVRSIRNAIAKNPYSGTFFVLGIIMLLIAPFQVYSTYSDLFHEIEVFQNKEFKGEEIAEVYEVNYKPGRGTYKKFRIHGQDFPTYPILLTNYDSDSLIDKGATVEKVANSNHFIVTNHLRRQEYELDDQRTGMTITMTIVLMMVLGWTIFMTFLGTLKKTDGSNDAQQSV